jgi:quinol monooxygenase YgiN
MSEGYFQVIAHYHVRSGQEEAVAGLLHELAVASRTESANFSYDYFQGVENPRHFVILERYTDEAGFAAHRESAHFQGIGLQQIIPRLESRRVESYEGVDVA